MKLRTPVDIGYLIRDQRKSRGWTQADLAARLGVSRLWVVQLEQGKDTAQIGLVMRVFNELGLPLQVAIGDTVLNDKPANAVDQIDLNQFMNRFKDSVRS
ncbi:MAG: helix-turn-helix transcriptional regulator [Verrucomicrobiaceae bacterium]|nr:helix-turn-helix transcriptional regulator [Verrucomicrobiaceae bacterium]